MLSIGGGRMNWLHNVTHKVSQFFGKLNVWEWCVLAITVIVLFYVLKWAWGRLRTREVAYTLPPKAVAREPVWENRHEWLGRFQRLSPSDAVLLTLNNGPFMLIGGDCTGNGLSPEKKVWLARANKVALFQPKEQAAKLGAANRVAKLITSIQVEGDPDYRTSLYYELLLTLLFMKKQYGDNARDIAKLAFGRSQDAFNRAQVDKFYDEVELVRKQREEQAVVQTRALCGGDSGFEVDYDR